MNLRQKAKHYKRLYESSKYSNVGTIVQSRELKHFRCEQLVYGYNEELVLHRSRELLNKADEQLAKSIVSREDLSYFGYRRLTLDFWTL